MSEKSFPQIVTHILQKAFFKHATERADCRNAFLNTLQSMQIAGMLFQIRSKTRSAPAVAAGAIIMKKFYV